MEPPPPPHVALADLLLALDDDLHVWLGHPPNDIQGAIYTHRVPFGGLSRCGLERVDRHLQEGVSGARVEAIFRAGPSAISLINKGL